MAKGEKVSKGFGFYLLMFILVLVAAFMVIVTIMLFSPKKVILGYQYFTYGDEYTIIKKNDTEHDLDLSSISKVTVNAHAASVSVSKTEAVKQDTVKVVNRATGFAKKNDNVDFKYSVKIDGSEMTIDIQEVEGFLFFSNNVNVQIMLPIDSEYDFKNTEFNITTTSGSVTIGATSKPKDESKDNTIDLRNLAVSTQTGNINITENVEKQFSNLSLSTSSGNFKTGIKDLWTVYTARVVTSKGKFVFQDLSCGEEMDLNLGNGQIQIGTIKGSINLVAHNAKINIGTVTGDFAANETADYIDKADIKIDTVEGDVSLPCAKRSNIEIKKVGGGLPNKGMINIVTTSGNVNIGENYNINMESWIQTDSGSITATVSNRNHAHYFTTKKGKIDLTYASGVGGENYITSTSGNVNLKLINSAKFVLKLANAEGKLFEKLDAKKHSIEFVDADKFTNPFPVNDFNGSGNYFIDIKTNGKVTGTLTKIN